MKKILILLMLISLVSCKEDKQDRHEAAISLIVLYLSDLQEKNILPKDPVEFGKVKQEPTPRKL